MWVVFVDHRVGVVVSPQQSNWSINSNGIYSLVALQAGGYSHPWPSAYILCNLIVGIALVGGWILWEYKFAPNPMVPKELFQGQRTVAVAFLVAFVGGINIYSSLTFFPLEASSVFPQDPVQVGLKGLAAGLGITFGATFVNSALSWLKGYNRELLVCSFLLMTAFGGLWLLSLRRPLGG